MISKRLAMKPAWKQYTIESIIQLLRNRCVIWNIIEYNAQVSRARQCKEEGCNSYQNNCYFKKNSKVFTVKIGFLVEIE